MSCGIAFEGCLPEVTIVHLELLDGLDINYGASSKRINGVLRKNGKPLKQDQLPLVKALVHQEQPHSRNGQFLPMCCDCIKFDLN